jgi:pimeloyl-ACP methyl ester carboxylesterase
MPREESVTFTSGGLALSGIVHIPDDLKAGDQRPAFLVLHGFGSNKSSPSCLAPCELLASMGYVAMRFDMRGCGESEGEFGRIICLEQVEDTKAAHAYLAARPEVDAARIGALGSSFGAAVAVYTAGVYEPLAAVVSSGGWGDGERKFRGQHVGAAWDRFVAMLEEGRRHREKTGTSLMVPRDDIVPIPGHLRTNLAASSVEMFPVETAQSMFDFRADDVVARIAPRPLLLLHAAVDSVTPTEQSIELFRRAGQPADLHLTAGTDHFMFADSNVRVRRILTDWLDEYMPVG